ncbi:MAG: DUF962 domain-containing protein [Gammaproteobacteria bacterium]|jgi:uncharacterized membrane protein YGL010W|nr:DUF962 domain-containing protein [Gammaproteobacteria bacterium]MBQ0775550.1 DUF962 domain-containing protein [Gammaproteobacteria bacterium]
MRTLGQFLDAYGESHRNPINQLVHFVCVPAIFFSSLGLLWLVPLGQWLGLEANVAYWVNGATALGVLAGVFYLRLSIATFVLMVAWFALSVAGVVAIERFGGSLLWISVITWVIAWAVQVYGHKVEGKKPSFADDLVFLLVGPVFVSVEIAAKLGIRTRHALPH